MIKIILKNIFFTILAAFILISAINTVYAGKYTAKDIKRLKAFADIGDPDAMNELGVFFLDGNYIYPKDIKKAVNYYKQAVELGNIPAMSNLGSIYTGLHEKEGINADYRKAINYINKAASAGYLPAYISLGYVYDEGIGIPKDLNLAEKYYKIAAEANVPLAQFDLAYFYTYSLKKPDGKRSHYWFKRAALNGYVNAYSYLALYYLYGFEFKKDLAKAFMYAKYAKLAGAQGGKNTLEKGILPIITPAEKAEGERLLKKYIKKHPINND